MNVLDKAEAARRVEKNGVGGDFTVSENQEFKTESGGRIAIHCNVCGCDFTRRVSTVLYRSYKCPQCQRRKREEQNLRRFQKMRGAFLELAEPSGKPNGREEFTKVRCKRCGNEWSVKTSALLDQSKKLKFGGCTKCVRDSFAKTPYEFEEALAVVLPNVKALDAYVNNYTKMHVRNVVCGHEWEADANSLLRGHDCQICKRENAYIEQLRIKRPNLKLMSHYEDSRLPIAVKCLLCGNEFVGVAKNFLTHPTEYCFNCAPPSLGAIRVRRVLDELSIAYSVEYKFPDCKNKRPLPFDFYIPKYNLCIEYDGEQHFRRRDGFWGGDEALEQMQYRDSVKTKYCEENGLHLLRIPYTEYDFVEEIVKNYITQLDQADQISAYAKGVV